MAQTNYDINYDDERFTQVEADKQQALTDLENTYSGMIGESDKYYQAQIDAAKQWATTQGKLQQEQTDFAIEQIEQQKDQAHKDYVKEQSGAYVDWQKQSNQYGVAAEQQAAAGMAGTGFSESSQVSMYNTYQNRVATARESFNQAILNYNNAIKDARLQNNSVLAEIAYQSLQQQLALSLEGFQYKNNLILEQTNKKVEMDNMYYNRYLDVLNQINTENAMAEDIRQYEQNYAFSVQQFNEQIRQFNQQYAESVRQFNQEYELRQKEYQEGIRQFNEEIERLKKKDAQEYEMEIATLELNKKKLEQEQKQWEKEMELKQQQLEEEKRQFDEQMAYQKSKKTSSGGGGGSTVKAVVKDDAPSGTGGSGGTYTDNRSSLGIGPASDHTMAQLINNGAVTYTVSGNNVNYKWAQGSQNTKKTLQLMEAQETLNKYTSLRY